MGQRPERDDLLRSIDLEMLFDRWYPTGHQRRTNAWPCPVHEGQTGRSPPVRVRVDDKGVQWWHCYACRAYGTAIDLVMARTNCSVADAFDELSGGSQGRDIAPAPRVVVERRRRQFAERLIPEAVAHLKACRDRLWTPAGDKGREYLRGRGLWDEELLRLNGIGYDPGKWHVPRPDMLHKGEAITWPVLDLDGRVVTYQGRQLWRKALVRWLSPSAEVGPIPPAVAYVAVPNPDPARPIILCEGLSDSLSAGRCGFRAMGSLGTAAMVDPRLSGAVQAACDRWGQGQVLVCGDNDKAGAPFNEAVVTMLREAGIDVSILALPGAHKDLNDWLCADGPDAVADAVIAGARRVPEAAGPAPVL